MSMTGATLLNPLYFMDGQISLEYVEAGDGSTRNKPAPDGRDGSDTAPLVEQLSASGQVLVGVQYSACAAAHEETGLPVVMVTGPQKLMSVSRQLRKLLPSNVSVAILVDDNCERDCTLSITRDDFTKQRCCQHDGKAGEVEEGEREQLERICAILECMAKCLEEFPGSSTHHDHRREAKEK
ncbi:hypothetical protein ACGTNF_13675 [Halomonas sp. THAF12]